MTVFNNHQPDPKISLKKILTRQPHRQPPYYKAIAHDKSAHEHFPRRDGGPGRRKLLLSEVDIHVHFSAHPWRLRPRAVWGRARGNPLSSRRRDTATGEGELSCTPFDFQKFSALFVSSERRKQRRLVFFFFFGCVVCMVTVSSLITWGSVRVFDCIFVFGVVRGCVVSLRKLRREFQWKSFVWWLENMIIFLKYGWKL